MIRDRERRGYNKKQGLNHLFLILLNSAEDYEKRFGHEMFLQIIAQYPGIKNLKKEQDKSSILRLVLWILNEKNIREEASRRDIALKLMEEYLIEEKKKAFHFYEESLHKNWRSYLEKLAKEVWDQFDPIKQEKRKQEYLALLESAIKDLNLRIASVMALIEAQATLEKRRALARRIMDIFDAEAIKSAHRGMNGINVLLPMSSECEAKKETILDACKRFVHSKDPSIIPNEIIPAVNRLKEHPDEFDYRSVESIIKDFQNAHNCVKLSREVALRIENKTDFIESQSIDAARSHLSQLKVARIQVTQELEKPAFDMPMELDNLLLSFDIEDRVQKLKQDFDRQIEIDNKALAGLSAPLRSEVNAMLSEFEQLSNQGIKQLQAIPIDQLKQNLTVIHHEPPVELDEQKPRAPSFR